jgi:hypothetical protein
MAESAGRVDLVDVPGQLEDHVGVPGLADKIRQSDP